MNADKKNVTAKVKAACWHSKSNATYASPMNQDGAMNIANQKDGLAYVLQAAIDVAFGVSSSLN